MYHFEHISRDIHHNFLFQILLILFGRIFCQNKKKFFYICEMKFFNNNLGIRAVIIYFCFVLIGLIKGYKKS